jgi:hypothetical protein
MKKYIKVEIGIVVVSVLVSLLAFWIEPNIVHTTNGTDMNTTTTGWPFAIKSSLAGMDVSYTGPFTTYSSSGLILDWLLLFVATLGVLNLGWWVLKSFESKPEKKTTDAE